MRIPSCIPRVRIPLPGGLLTAALALMAAVVGESAAAQQPWVQAQLSCTPFSGQLNGAVTSIPATTSTASFQLGTGGNGLSFNCAASHSCMDIESRTSLEFGARAMQPVPMTFPVFGSASISTLELKVVLSVAVPETLELEIDSILLASNAVGAGVVRGPDGLEAATAVGPVLYRKVVHAVPGAPITVTLSGSAAASSSPASWYSFYSTGAVVTLRRVYLRAFDGLSHESHGPWKYLSGFTSAGATGITDDTERLVQEGTQRGIVAADGTARLLIAFDAPVGRAGWPVRFRVEHDGQSVTGTPAQGWISEPAGTFQQVTQLTPVARTRANDPQCHWYLVYRAPDDFVRQNQVAADTAAVSRALRFIVEWQDPATLQWVTASALDCKIRRAPVVVTHGLWSGIEVFDVSAFRARLVDDHRFDTLLLGYDEDSARSFTQNKRLVIDAVRQWVPSPTRQSLDSAHPEGVAYARVDWIGHSMGGVLPRIAAQELQEAEWRSIETYGLPPLRRLILVDSPQRGSTGAQALAHFANSPILPWLAREFVGAIDQGAIADLAEDSPWFDPSSPIHLRALTDVRAHAICGAGPEVLVAQGRQLLGRLLSKASHPLVKVVGALMNLDFLPLENLVYRTDPNGQVVPHDIAVHRDSQQADLPGGARTDYYIVGSLLNPPPTLHTNNLQSDLYALRAAELLDKPVASPFFAELPEITTPLIGQTFALLPSTAGVPQFLDLGPLTWNTVPSTVAPGTVITLQVQPPPGVALATVQFVADGNDPVTVTAPPFQVQFTVPADAFGAFTAMALGHDGSQGIALSSELVIPVPLAANLVELRPIATAIDLYAPLDQRQIAIDALFSDGQVRRLNRHSPWPSMQIADPNVANVDAIGLVTARTRGTTSLLLQLNGVTATVPVDVQFNDLQHYGNGTHGSAGRLPWLTANQPALVGDQEFGLDLTNVPLNTVGLVVLGFAPARIPVLGIDLLVDPTQAWLELVLATEVAAPGLGRGELAIPLPSDPSLAGLVVFAQAACFDPGATAGLSASDGLAITIR